MSAVSMSIERNGIRIISIGDWKTFAGPKSLDQWVEDRSAYELARTWCGPDGRTPSVPPELRDLLDSRAESRGMEVDRVFPEHRISFDAHGGEPRNADLAFVGQVAAGSVAVTVEAKADEPYGATIAKTMRDALERKISNPRSRGVERIADLVAALLPPWAKGAPKLDGLYYQLLTATAGSIGYAIEQSAPVAVLIVHEFMTSKTKDPKHDLNNRAYSAFIHRLRGRPVPDSEMNGLLGPFTVPGTPLFDRPPALLIGKITTNRRGRDLAKDG